MMCSICRRGPAWGIRLIRVGTMRALPTEDARDFSGVMACQEDLEAAVNILVQEGGVYAVDPANRNLIHRRLSVIQCEAA